MDREGPPLELLTRRLAETPAEFLGSPRIGERGQVVVAAVVHDLLQALGVAVEPAALDRFDSTERGEAGALSLALVFCWLLHDPWFRGAKLAAPGLLALLGEEAREIAAHRRKGSLTESLLGDAERREELARLALARLGFRPSGETLAQAQDRLTSLSSRERARLMKAARAAEERSRKIREELAKKAAEESADKWTRE